MSKFIIKPNKKDDIEAISNYQEAFQDPHLTVAGRLLDDLASQDTFVDLGHQWGQEYKKESFLRPLSITSFQNISAEDEELVFEMIRKGVGWEKLGPYFK